MSEDPKLPAEASTAPQAEPRAVAPTPAPAKSKKPKSKKPKKEKLPERDIQTWLRLTSKNLYTRRRQLDQKASILMSINAVMVTLIVGTVYPTVDHNQYLTLSLLPVTLTNLISMYLTVRAMRPEVHRRTGVAKAEEIEAHAARLVTFDDFYKMTEEDYLSAVGTVLRNQDFLHTTLIKDIYNLGIELFTRFRLLGIAYDVFMLGIVSTGLLFVLVEILTSRGVI